MKCKFYKICKYYDSISHTCNIEQFNSSNEPYCGKYKIDNEELNNLETWIIALALGIIPMSLIFGLFYIWGLR